MNNTDKSKLKTDTDNQQEKIIPVDMKTFKEVSAKILKKYEKTLEFLAKH